MLDLFRILIFISNTNCTLIQVYIGLLWKSREIAGKALGAVKGKCLFDFAVAVI